MALGLTVLRHVNGPFDKGLSSLLKVSMEFQMKKLAAEAKRLNDPTEYVRVANIQRLAKFEKPNPEEQPDLIFFMGGYLDNDYPRDYEVTEAIMENTDGFAIAGPDGKVIAKFDKLADAQAAIDGARIETKIAVDLPKEVKAEAVPA